MLSKRVRGIALVILSILIVILASQGTSPEDRNATAVLFLLPLGIYLIIDAGEEKKAAGKAATLTGRKEITIHR